MYNLYGEEIEDINDPYKNGEKFEHLVEEFLKKKYPNSFVKSQVFVGTRPGTSDVRYKVDVVIDKILISAKSQNTNGTADEKFPGEMNVLEHMCLTYNYDKAYIVYHGKGFREKLIKSYKTPEYEQYIKAPHVEIYEFEDFKELDILND